MKIQTVFILIASCFCIFPTLAQNTQNPGGLPINLHYPVPLQRTRIEILEKYSIMEYSNTQHDIVQIKCYPTMSKAKAKKLIEDRKFLMKITFADQVSPYPGVISSTVGCPDDLKPKAKEDTTAINLEYKLLATSNLIYGNCNINDNYYYSIFHILFCPERQELYEVKIFTPIQKPSFDYQSIDLAPECGTN